MNSLKSKIKQCLSHDLELEYSNELLNEGQQNLMTLIDLNPDSFFSAFNEFMTEQISYGEQADRYHLIRYLQTINELDSPYIDLKINSLLTAMKLVHDSVMRHLISQEANKLIFADHDLKDLDKVEAFRNQIISFLEN